MEAASDNLQNSSKAPLGLPSAVLYATSAGLGGSGLDSTSVEGALAAERAGILKRAICFPNRQTEIPRSKVTSLQAHPVRLLSCLSSPQYYRAKKRYLDWYTSKQIKKGGIDLFHGWSGDCLNSLIHTRSQGIASVMDVPTWHRNKGVQKPNETRAEREQRLSASSLIDRFRSLIDIPRLQNLLEYDLVDVLLMPSLKSRETFLEAGIHPDRLAYVGRGVDLNRYQPGKSPDIFRVCFVGALIKRKGVHLLLKAWHRLNLKDAELVLVGTLHEEMHPYLNRFKRDNVKVLGFVNRVQDLLRESAVFAFPSECEGFAKSTLEASACGLPLIATAESGDAIVNNVTGIQIPAGKLDALTEALRFAYEKRDLMLQYGKAGRERVIQHYSWDHYRQRILEAYQLAMKFRRKSW